MTKLAGDGVALFHVTIMMLAISWVTMLSRLAVRRWLKPEAMGVDDYLMCASLVRNHPIHGCSSHLTLPSPRLFVKRFLPVSLSDPRLSSR